MYEDITFETILGRMLDRVPGAMDKREGSIIYDALAPAAVELQLMYIELDTILRETFGDTASREFLIRRAKERGLSPETATHAILKGECQPADIELPEGARFSLDGLNYVFTGVDDNGNYRMMCEEAGSIGNKSFGLMVPVEYINGLKSAALTELLIPGQDEEETERFRQRYLNSFDSKAYGGNVADYIAKTNSIQGVGATRVTPVWQGGGTVRLTILDSQYCPAGAALVQEVQNEIDPTGDGHGIGIAPIGHVVTVDAPAAVPIHISTRITFASGGSYEQYRETIEQAIESYLLELRKNWAVSATGLVVRVSQIENRIMNLDGVLDIESTAINGVMGNLETGIYEVPVFGGLDNG